MKKQFFLAALACATLVAAGASYACSTMVVGKAVSKTGTIIVGHNEDNDLRIVTSQYYVPAADHAVSTGHKHYTRPVTRIRMALSMKTASFLLRTKAMMQRKVTKHYRKAASVTASDA